MAKIDIFEAAKLIVDIASRILVITSKPFNAHENLSTQDQDRVNEHWQEISRIAAENAAKPEIQGFAAHDSNAQQTQDKES